MVFMISRPCHRQAAICSANAPFLSAATLLSLPVASAISPRGRIISCSEVASGTLSTININIRQIVDDAVRRRCTTVILAHNHPNGYAFPSAEDRIFTDELKKALKIMEIRLKDHIIVADDDYVSFAQSGYI